MLFFHSWKLQRLWEGRTGFQWMTGFSLFTEISSLCHNRSVYDLWHTISLYLTNLSLFSQRKILKPSRRVRARVFHLAIHLCEKRRKILLYLVLLWGNSQYNLRLADNHLHSQTQAQMKIHQDLILQDNFSNIPSFLNLRILSFEIKKHFSGVSGSRT